MCVLTETFLRCSGCPWNENLGFELIKCGLIPEGKSSCKEITTATSYRDYVCESCTPASTETVESYQIRILLEQLSSRTDFLKQTTGFPDPSSPEWQGFWKRLDKGTRDLFIEVWSLQGEIEWLHEESVMAGSEVADEPQA